VDPDGVGMSMVGDTVSWLAEGKHWSGTDGVPHRMLEHVALSATAVAIAAAIALPVALWLGHVGRGGALAVNVSNAGRAVPVVALLVLLAVSPVGFGNRATIIALAVFAVPPILTNAYVGMRGVDVEVKEAARGMGMTGRQLLRRVEMPLAVPLIAAGIRTATVQVVATATLAALVAGGGLGRFLVDGYGRQDYAMVYAGAVLVALLSVTTEVVLGALQRRLTPGRAPRRTLAALRPEQTPTGEVRAA
jgi:osmoprotectant transport system permease protein